jgi:hypothetical protein
VWKITSSIGGWHPHLVRPVANMNCLTLRVMYFSMLRGLDHQRLDDAGWLSSAEVTARDAGRLTTSMALRCAAQSCAVLCWAGLGQAGPGRAGPYCVVLFCIQPVLQHHNNCIAPNCSCT